MGFVFADVEPLAVIVRRAPGPCLIGGEEPGVIFLAEFSEGLFADLVKDVDIVVAIVTFDGGAAGVSELHGRVPLLLDVLGP